MRVNAIPRLYSSNNLKDILSRNWYGPFKGPFMFYFLWGISHCSSSSLLTSSF